MGGWLAAILGALAALAALALLWLIVWLARRRRAAQRRSAWGSPTRASRGAQDIERLFRDAAQKTKIRDLPVYLLIGDQGSGKTSLILNSGLQSELLAGQNRQGSPITPTERLNLWLINGSLVIEAPAPVWKDHSLATVLLRQLRYPALKTMLGRRRNAPRAVIACIPADLLGSNTGLGASVGPVNEFLLLACKELGIALPVYAVLTRADGLKGFREIFFNLKPAEATEVLGASLDSDQPADRATYGEIAQSTLNAACKKLVTFLQSRRTSLLVREYELERLWAGYEFPRRLDRYRTSLARALTAMCSPSLIQTSPVLRGFYFTGVRRTLRQEGMSVPTPVLGDAEDGLSATRMFRPGAAFLPQAQSPAAARTEEEVEEWAFSRRLLKDVIFADTAAVNVSGYSHFRDLYRAVLCWAGAGIALAAIGGGIVSFARNSSLERTLKAGMSEARLADRPLAALDRYRGPVDRLIDYRDAVPMSMRWGLYEGRSLFPAAQRDFCTETKRALVDTTVRSMERQLAQGKGSPDYDSLYRMLKAELMMSSNPEKTDAEFLAGELAGQAAVAGVVARGGESAVEPLLRTYARLLTIPEQQEYCIVLADSGVVRQARAYLREASAEDKIYTDLLSKAGRGIPGVDYNRLHGNEAVHDSYVVPGAFTAGAWARMQGYLDQPEKLISTETWVLGETQSARPDPRVLSGQLRNRYASDYAARWREYLKQGAVAHYANLDDAARKLDIIAAGNQSALLWLFDLATEHTSAGEPVASVFQPVRELVAKAGDFSVGIPYLGQLIGIKALLPGAAHLTGPPRDQAFDQIRMATTQARKFVAETGLKFRTADVGTQVTTLLLAPIVQVEDLLNAQGAADLAGAGAGLCAPYNAIYAKFPFQPDAAADADPEQVLSLLKPNEGPVWKFYSANLADSLDLGEFGFTPKLNPRVPLRREFVQFMNRVWAQSRIFYGTADDPGFRLNLRAVPNGIVRSIDIYIDDQHYPLSPGGSTTINWSLRRSRKLRLELQFAGIQEPPQTLTGPWALLRWLYSAENPSAEPLDWILRSGRLVRKTDSGQPITYRLDVKFPDNSPFDIRKLAGARCVPAAAK
jgi:type VI secretion system protein ImpL